MMTTSSDEKMVLVSKRRKIFQITKALNF